MTRSKTTGVFLALLVGLAGTILTLKVTLGTSEPAPQPPGPRDTNVDEAARGVVVAPRAADDSSLEADATEDLARTAVSAAPDHLREAAERWLPVEYHGDGGMLGAAKVLQDLDDDKTAALWTGGDVTFEQMLQSHGVAPDASSVPELGRMDAALARQIQQKQREVMQIAMSGAIEMVITGKAILYRPERPDRPQTVSAANPASATSALTRIRAQQDQLLREAYPEFDLEELSVVKIGGDKPGTSRLIPFNPRDHRAYFAAQEEVSRLRAARRAAWRDALQR